MYFKIRKKNTGKKKKKDKFSFWREVLKIFLGLSKHNTFFSDLTPLKKMKV